MKPWIIDAQDIALVADLSSFERHLFHKSGVAEHYLDKNNTDALVLLGPKGSGKTLLLKAKRLSIAGDGVFCIPENALVDRPIGTPRIYSQTQLDPILNDSSYWKNAWLIAIALSTILHIDRQIDVEEFSPELADIIRKRRLTSPTDIFSAVLEMKRKDYFSSTDDFRRILAPKFRSIHTPVYIFIDNVDEYFESHLSVIGESKSASGQTDKTLWYLAQVGLATAARELKGTNPHIKICTTLRKEIITFLVRRDLGLQLLGGMQEISYTKEDLVDIINRNLAAEPPSNRAVPGKGRFSGFVTEGACELTHTATGQEERFDDYLIRHTLWRPRDIAVYGKAISRISPPSRRTATNIIDLINSTAEQLVRTYFSECRPHLADFDERYLLELIPQNVLTRTDLDTIVHQYSEQEMSRNGSLTQSDPFLHLFRTGLLGIIRLKPNGSESQYFALPGESNPHEILPDSRFYLIHPILDSYIGTLNRSYLANMDSINIIGHELTWLNHNDVSYVLKGDIAQFTQIMHDPELAAIFPSRFEKIVGTAASGLDHYIIEGGDTVFLIDRSALNPIKAAAAINHAVRAIFGKELRFGGSSGYVIFQTKENVRGRALRTASRIEPFAARGAILVSGDYHEELKRRGLNKSFSPASPESHPHVPVVNGQFDVGKGQLDFRTEVELFEAHCDQILEAMGH